jgi:hypothetical protein
MAISSKTTGVATLVRAALLGPGDQGAEVLAAPAKAAALIRVPITLLRKAGAGNPSGRTYHAAFGPPEKLMVFDVWTSQAAFDKFGKTLTPILAQIGLDTGPPQVMMPEPPADVELTTPIAQDAPAPTSGCTSILTHAGGLSNVIIYSIGLGNAAIPLSPDLLQRVSNDPRSSIYNSSLPAGAYIAAPTSADIDAAFALVASEILRLSR